MCGLPLAQFSLKMTGISIGTLELTFFIYGRVFVLPEALIGYVYLGQNKLKQTLVVFKLTDISLVTSKITCANLILPVILSCVIYSKS